MQSLGPVADAWGGLGSAVSIPETDGGQGRVVWRQDQLYSTRGVAVEWGEGERVVDGLARELEDFHGVLARMASEVSQVVEAPKGGGVRDNSESRAAGQLLADSIILELHRGHRKAA